MYKKLDALTIKQIIMDHYEYPRNKGLKSLKGYKQVHQAAESCIDDIKVELKMEGDKIADIVFDGKACTISTASTSMMTELVKGKTLEEAYKIIEAYEKMIYLEDYDENLLEEANVFSNVGKQANRISCAMIGWNALKELLQSYNDESRKDT